MEIPQEASLAFSEWTRYDLGAVRSSSPLPCAGADPAPAAVRIVRAAEYDDGQSYHRGSGPASAVRLGWRPGGDLQRSPSRTTSLPGCGNHVDVFTFGLSLAAIGAAQAAVSPVPLRRLRLPAPSAYRGRDHRWPPRSSTRRLSGVLQGMLLAIGLPNGSAILVQAIIYVLATRMAAPGRTGTCSCYRSGLASAAAGPRCRRAGSERPSWRTR